MSKNAPELFTAPWLLGSAFLLLGVAILEKGLNLAGMDIPLIDVFPRQILDWAVTLLILDIALTLRQIFDMNIRLILGERRK